MTFLSGSLAFERFQISGFVPQTSALDDKLMATLQAHAAGRFDSSSLDEVQVGFTGGEHLFDLTLNQGKNVIADTIHCGVRIDTHQIPAAIRKAWLQMELSAAAQENSSGKPSKAQRQEAKETIEQRCRDEAATGKYRRMQSFPLLWELRKEQLLFGGAGNAAAACAGLFESAFAVELTRLSAGALAWQWAQQADRFAEVDDLQPLVADIAWLDGYTAQRDFLGNEFLLWLWWQFETVTDSLTLPDETELTWSLNKTLTLEDPAGESGKETIAAEMPIRLPEAKQAIRSGKLPRKTGLSLIRQGQQFDLTLQAETFAVSGAKIVPAEDAEGPLDNEQRIAAIGDLTRGLDLLYQAFLQRRVSSEWLQTEQAIKEWLSAGPMAREKAA